MYFLPVSCFEIQPGNQNPLDTGYCPEFLLYHLLGEVIDAFLCNTV